MGGACPVAQGPAAARVPTAAERRSPGDHATGGAHRIAHQSAVLLREDGPPRCRERAPRRCPVHPGAVWLLHCDGSLEKRFDDWCEALAKLPRRQTRVLTWPLATVFRFIAQPRQHIFLKPMVTRRAASRWDCAFHYVSHPGGHPYAAYLKLARVVRTNLADWKQRDLIDIQSFLWVQGSDEYP